MPWPLRFVLHDQWLEDGQDGTHKPGDWTFAPWILNDYPETLGKHYYSIPEEPDRNRYRRFPIVIILPDLSEWCPDRMACGDKGWHGDGWHITGSLCSDTCKITITPSINVINRYHGWVRDGVITDDCEGRTFSPLPPVKLSEIDTDRIVRKAQERLARRDQSEREGFKFATEDDLEQI